MLLIVPAILKPDELALARSWLAEAPFVDGKLSAGAAARRVKENEERDRNAADVERLDRLVMGALARHPAYRNGALPLHAASPLYARYRPGMTYGEHLDDPIMGTGGVLYRSDVAVTVFLSDPGAYDGGELVIRTAAGEHSVKEAAGDAVLYPASTIHHVNPVTRGERLVAVTWVQSLVRDPARRELLYGLNLAREKLLAAAPEAEETAQVNAAYLNLIRMWSDL
ncbi:MAG: Fe2+-dependent dioxygenase [Betaproteobacteria bacterium]|nr:Fe2+-dependent dioxygenase [Betaproteobacteria bacterium]MDH5352057.1 Fe2+-dependent dioxygenase [Betaproteobacteria bacterium]